MAPKESSVEQTGTTMEYTRLHITPFNASLLSAIVPPSMSCLAKNISFHNIETFPEKAYGYVELPKEQATKIKQKLNGAVLRGSKIVIQEARAAPRIVSPDPEMAKREKKRKEKKAKGEIPQPEEKLEDSAPKEKNRKRKRHDEPLRGQEVTDRQIKRGWTDPNAESKAQKKENRSREKDLDIQAKKDKKAEREKSKYTTGAEALIRTTLPPNVALPAKGIEGVVVDKKAKKSKSGKKDVVLHEFARTEKFATFLRQKALPGAAKPSAEFREGEGWFDEDGNKVEGKPPKSKRNDDVLKNISKESRLENPKKAKKAVTPEPEPEFEEESDEEMTEAPKMIYNSDSETSSSGSSASESEDEELAGEAEEEKKNDIEDIFAAVGSSSDSESQQASSPAAKSADKVRAEENFPASAAAKSRSPSPPLSAQKAIEEPVYIHTTTFSARPVTPVTSTSGLKIAIPENPLEAIFKPKKAAADKVEETSTPFSFGNLGADIDSDYEEEKEFTIEQAPMTPFTQQDVAWRNIRSAAPTPDTAHPSRKQMSGWPAEEGEDVNGYNSRSPTEMGKGKGKKGAAVAGEEEGALQAPQGTDPNADFQKWFYENRGDTNRAWKKRRKEAKKEVRQRENRKGGNNKLQ